MPEISSALIYVNDLSILFVVFQQLLHEEQPVSVNLLVFLVCVNRIFRLNMLDPVSLVVLRQRYSRNLFIELFLDNDTASSK